MRDDKTRKYTEKELDNIADEILKAWAADQVEQDAKKFAEIFDSLEPALVVELAEEAKAIMKSHNISDAGYEGAVAESGLMWMLLQQRKVD